MGAKIQIPVTKCVIPVIEVSFLLPSSISSIVIYLNYMMLIYYKKKYWGWLCYHKEKMFYSIVALINVQKPKQSLILGKN